MNGLVSLGTKLVASVLMYNEIMRVLIMAIRYLFIDGGCGNGEVCYSIHLMIVVIFVNRKQVVQRLIALLYRATILSEAPSCTVPF